MAFVGRRISSRDSGPRPPQIASRPAQPPATFASLDQPEALAKAKTGRDKDDPSLGCAPTAFGTLNISLFDVGAVGQIVQTPKFMDQALDRSQAESATGPV